MPKPRSPSVTGAVLQNEAVAPFFPVVLTALVVEVVAVKIEVSIGQAQAAVFDESATLGGVGCLANSSSHGERQQGK